MASASSAAVKDSSEDHLAIIMASAIVPREERYTNPFLRFLTYSSSKRAFYGRMRELVYKWVTLYMSKPPKERGMTAEEYIRKLTLQYVRTLTKSDCERGISDYGLQDALDLWREQCSDIEYPCVVSLYNKLIHMAIEEEFEVIQVRWEHHRGANGPM